MCPPPAKEEAKMERVADVIKADPRLAGCTTVAAFCSAKPGVGSVLLGGNYLGPEHGLSNNAGLTCTVGSRYVAQCCFVPEGMTRTILLLRTATVGDLKRQFYCEHPRPVAAAISALGLPASTEQACVDAIMCKDPKGSILADTDPLPAATATVCADVGCHARFFLAIKPLSMRQDYVERRIKASPSAIAGLVRAPYSLGTYANGGPVTLTQSSASFAQVRSGLDARLTASTRAVPARISAAELEEILEVFRLMEEDDECRSNLPCAIRRYAQELIENIAASRFDALNPDFATRISEHLAELEESVKELVHLQTDDEWINYATTTEHPAGMSVDEIASQLEEGRGHVRLHEQIQLLKVQMTTGEMDRTRGECEEFAAQFEALRGIAERGSATRADLSQKSIKYDATCDTGLRQAKEADVVIQATLQDEIANVGLLDDVKKEHTSLHDIVGEQIKWCKDSIAASDADSKQKVQGLDREMQRLKELKQQEVLLQEHLAKCTTHLDTVEQAENTDADAFHVKWAAAHCDARQRVQRSTAGVEQSAQFVEWLWAMHAEIKQEHKDAMEYHEVLMKQVGVDCHGTFLNTGKFLAIQAAVAEKNQKRAHETHDAKQRASLEANALRDADLQDTLEHAKQAEDELAKAAHNLTQSITKTAKNKGERDKLKGDIEDVHSLLRGSPRTPSPRGAKLVVHSLPDLAAFREVRSVAEYRDYRDDLAVSRPAAAASSQTLELLEDYERDFELRYRGESEGNLASLSAGASNKFWRLLGR